MTPLHGCLISIPNINHSKLNSPLPKPSPHRSFSHHYRDGSFSPKAEVILDSHTPSKLSANLPANEYPNSNFLPPSILVPASALVLYSHFFKESSDLPASPKSFRINASPTTHQA